VQQELLLDLVQNDQTPMAMGEYLNTKGVKSLYLMGPNYAAGKDMLAGVKRTYKGKIIARTTPSGPISSISRPSSPRSPPPSLTAFSSSIPARTAFSS